jgi:polysaccharide biosynthesis transport protein
MSESKHTNDRRQPEPAGAGIAVDDIYYVLFRQKWKIVACSAAGFLAAIALLIIKPAQYESEAKLMIRYVTDTKSPTQSNPDSTVTRSPETGGIGIINTEIDILTSLDTVHQVVTTLGAENILAKAWGGSDTNAAAALILKNLLPDPTTKDSVITVTYQHPDREMARAVLSQVIVAYLKKHADLHQPVGIYGEVLDEETKRLSATLTNTERELQEAKRSAGIISLEDSKKAYTDEISKLREALFTAEAELTEHQAAAKEAGATTTAPSSTTTSPAVQIPPERAREYRIVCNRLQEFLQKEQDDSIKYGENSLFTKDTQKLVAEAKLSKQRLEAQTPALTNLVVAPVASVGTQGAPLVDLALEALKVSELQSKTNFLNTKLAALHAEVAELEKVEDPIQDLERRKEAQEANLKYFLNRRDQNRINAELGNGGSEGISIVQSPSPAVKKRSAKLKKMLAMTLAGGVFAGLGLAFFLELVVDRSVRRSNDIEKKLRLPLYISIPDKQVVAVANGHKLLTGPDASAVTIAANGARENGVEAAGNGNGQALEPFYAGLRDRLIVNFEIRNLLHKPKLVAVTSCNKGAGVSTIAAGLAASLSETGDGNVLLVDMNAEQGMAQQFYKGRPGCALDDALESETMNNALIEGNLYVASERLDGDTLPRVLPRRFASLMPKLKASDYDYIIFDMPPVSQTSMTPRLAGLMDMVLLVIESEKTNVDVVKRANALLAESRANVSAVLNKTRTYIPPKLHQEFLNDT